MSNPLLRRVPSQKGTQRRQNPQESSYSIHPAAPGTASIRTLLSVIASIVSPGTHLHHSSPAFLLTYKRQCEGVAIITRSFDIAGLKGSMAMLPNVLIC